MSLEDVKNQLEHQNREQERTTDSIDALRAMFLQRFKLEDRGKLDELEALKEGAGKGAKSAPARAKKAKVESQGFDPLGMLSRFSLPALVALGASLTGFDAAIKALKIPSYLSTIRTSLTSISDMFGKMNTRALNLVDKIKAIKLPEIKIPRLPDLPKLQVTFPESWTKLGTRISTAIGDALPKADNIKIPRIPLPDFETFRTNLAAKFTNILPSLDTVKELKVRLPSFDNLPKISLPVFGPEILDKMRIKLPSFDNLPKIPEIAIPESLTKFSDSIRAFGVTVQNLKFPELKIPESLKNFKLPDLPKFPEMPKFEFLDADGKPFKFPELKIPEALRNLKFPDMSKVTTFFTGAGEGGGIVGFLKNAAGMVGKIPGISMIARIVGGPVTQAIVSIIDFFVGFYKGFTETELDADGNEISKSFGDKLMAGLEGGIDGVFKGIIDGIQLLFLDVPKWILSKMGVDMSWMDGLDLWEDLVSPVWESIKGIFKFIFSPDYRQEQIAKVKTAWDEAGGIAGIAMGIWDAITGALSDAMKNLPTPAELYEKLLSYLPNWMRPEGDNEELARLQQMQAAQTASLGEIATSQGKQIADLAPVDFQRHFGNPQAAMGAAARLQAYRNREQRIAELLTELPEGALGGYTNPLSSKLGSLMKIHPNELIVPLGSTPEGQALKQLGKVLNSSAAELQNAQRESSAMSGTSMPAVINNIVDNSSRSSSNINNRSSFSAPAVTVDTNLPVTLY